MRYFLGETRENSLRELIIGNNFDYVPCIFYSCFRVLISFTLDEEEKMSGLAFREASPFPDEPGKGPGEKLTGPVY